MRSAPVVAAIGLAVVLAAPLSAAKRPGPLDLVEHSAIRIVGGAASDRAGWSVARAGDVNGDRRMDVIIGAPTAGYNDRESSGSAYVVFGQRAPATVDLADLGDAGFRIDGAAVGDAAGFSVSTAGDVNGDGKADVLVGAPEADNNDRAQSGSVYVVFGQRASTAVDLANLGNRGFRIDGADVTEFAGFSVADAGDVNGDRRRDILIGAPFAANGAEDDPFGEINRQQSGSLYVVFGRASAANLDLATLGTRGFRIDGPERLGRAAWSSANAGDVNKDGRADILLGAPFLSNNGRIYSGTAYVVFGKSSAETVDLGALGQRGLQIDGDAEGDVVFGGVGWSVAGAGDVNGDGRSDVLIGSTAADPYGREDSGTAFVVFGQGAGKIDLAALRNRGFRINGAARYDYAASSVAGAGDVNGDGKADVVVSAEQADQNRREDSGSAYVVFGRRSTSAIDLAKLGRGGLRLDGATADDLTGWSVSGLGDMNGDGQPDVLVGAQAASASGRERSGAVYVAFLPDLIAPALEVSARTPQRVLRANGVTVTASCDERCTLRASGRVVTQNVGLDAASSTLSGPGRRTLLLKLRPTARERLALLLDAGEQLEVGITVRGTDSAGNARFATRSVDIVP